MLKYFKECMNDDSDINSLSQEICLISGEVLKEYFVTLRCSHKFNYLPLFNEVYKQKRTINHREVCRTPHWALKCPYCRTISPGILPYRELLEPSKINGVNWPENHSIKTNNCEYIFKTGKRKGSVCEHMCVDKYCSKHKKIAIKNEIKEKESNENNTSCKNKKQCCYIMKKGDETRQCRKFMKNETYIKNKGLLLN